MMLDLYQVSPRQRNYAYQLPTFDSFIAKYNPLIHLKFDALSGNLVNYGSLALTITTTNVLYNQPAVGYLGGPSCSFVIGNDAVISIADVSVFGALQAFTHILIGTLSGIDTGGSRLFEFFGATATLDNIQAGGQLEMRVQRTGANATYTGPAGEITVSQNCRSQFFTFNAADAEALRVYRSQAGTWSKVQGIVQGSGAASIQGSPFRLFNRAANDRDIGATFGRYVCLGEAMSEQDCQIAALLAGAA